MYWLFIQAYIDLLNLVLLNPWIGPAFANSVDPDQQLKIRNGIGILIYSAGQGLIYIYV